MSLKDLYYNFQFARFGLVFEVTDPFMKRTVEEELRSRGIRYVTGYNDNTRAFIYCVVGAAKPVKQNLRAMVEAFKRLGDWHYFTGRHPWGPKVLTIII